MVFKKLISRITTPNIILYRRIWKKYQDFQFIICIEECAELQKAITKYLRAKKIDELEAEEKLIPLYEEIADVEIICEQLRLLRKDATNNIDKIKQEKLNKLKTKMGWDDLL